MASSAENSNSFTGPTIPWSSVIPTQWRIISGRVLIVRFGDGASAFCVGAAVTSTDRLSIYPFTGVPLAFSSFLFFYFYFYFFILTSVLLIFKLFIYLFSSSFFLSFSFKFSFLFFYPHPSFLFLFLFFFYLFLYLFFNLCLFNSLSSEYACFCNVYR